MTEEEIASLLNRIAERDDKAVTMLYKYCYPILFPFILYRVKDHTAAEEVTHDVFMSVIKQPSGFNAQARFSTWMCGIAKYKIVDWWRVHYPDKRFEGISEEVDAIADTALRPDERARISARDVSPAEYCVEKLPPAMREAIRLAYIEGENLVSIAQRQDCPVGTIKSRLSTARASLKKCIERCSKEESHG